MVVCLCKGVSDRKIRWLVQNGANLRDIMTVCQAGSDCGSCLCQIRHLIEETRSACDDDKDSGSASGTTG